MTEKEMKKLSRTELLQLLLIQTKETERLQKELDRAEQMLADRRIRIEKAGDLAQAVLEINNVAVAAQQAAQQYLDNITAMEEETRKRCSQMLAEARKEAAQVRNGGQPTASSGNAEGDLLDEIYKLLDA